MPATWLEAELDAPRRLTPRQEDNVIYKMMALIIFAIFGFPIGYALTRGTPLPGIVAFIAAFFLFQAGWDLAMLATGHGDRLRVTSPRLIFAKALSRTIPPGIAMLVFSLEGDARIVAVVIFLTWIIEDILVGRRSAGSQHPAAATPE